MKKVLLLMFFWYAVGVLNQPLQLPGAVAQTQQWYSGDTHIHSNGCGGNLTPQELFALVDAAGLNVGCALVWGGGPTDTAYFSGEDSPVSQPDKILHYDLEVSGYPSDIFGHFIALNLQNINFPPRLFTLSIAEWALAQGAVVGYAHGSSWGATNYNEFPSPGGRPHEFPIDLALEKVHFLATEAIESHQGQPNVSFQFLWTTLLNSGFKIPITGASDYPCIAEGVGRNRTYALVEPPLTYSKWVNAVKQGRTVIAQGADDFLSYTVNGAVIGSEVQLSAPDDITVDITTNLGHAGTVEIVVNGNVVATANVNAGPQQQVTHSIPIVKSSWIAMRAPRVQTGASYIMVAGKPIRVSRSDPQYFINYINNFLAQINAGEFSRHDIDPVEFENEMQEARPKFLQARAVFEQRANEAPGGNDTISVSINSNIIPRYAIAELTIEHDESPYTNPWEEVFASVQFTGPEGQVYAIDGFYYNTDLWKVRFSPPAVGEWKLALTFATPTDTLTDSGSFTCEPSERPGFVKRHPTNPFRLIFEDGSLFNAIGIGDCIFDADGNGMLDEWGFDGDFRPPDQHDAGWSVDMPTYMAAYGDSGAGFNLFRWSIDNCAFKLWDYISTNGNRYLVQEGMLGDDLVEALSQNGFRVWLTFFGFNPAFPNAANNPAEQAAVERYLRYVVARYGAYVDIWELMNEAEAPENWIAFAADFVRSIDPYERLITTSWERPQLQQIDINTPHWYEKESEFESDLRTSQKISAAKHWGKLVIFGEQGNSIQNWDERSGLRMRLRSWTAFFEEGALIFWNSSFAKDYFAGAANLYIGPEERSHISALQDFTADVDADVERFVLSSTNHDVRAYGLQSSQTILGYFHHFSDHENSTSTTISVNLTSEGSVLWFDPASGDTLQSFKLSSGEYALTTPPFVVDLALKILFDNATIVEQDPIVPDRFILEQNYPNPFNPSTTISFTIPIAAEATLRIFDIRGCEVESLVNSRLNPGEYTVQWNANGFSNGVYFYRLQISDPLAGTDQRFVETKKLVLLK